MRLSIFTVMVALPVLALHTLKLSELRSIVEQRGVSCNGCVTKQDFVRAIEEASDSDFDENGVADLSPVSPSVGTGPRHVRFSVCTSCGYGAQAQKYAQHLTTAFPGVEISIENHSPPLHMQLLSTLMTFVFFGCMCIYFLGPDRILPPPLAVAVRQHNSVIGAVAFLCFMFSSKIIATGAFEIFADDKLVWSKLQTGGVPQPDQLLRSIGNLYGLRPPSDFQ